MGLAPAAPDLSSKQHRSSPHSPRHAAPSLLLQGEQLSETIAVPRLRVRRTWFVGVNPDPVDHSKPDVGGAAVPFEQRAAAGKVREGVSERRRGAAWGAAMPSRWREAV